MHKCRGRLLLGEKLGLRVKLTVKSCVDHQGVKSNYFKFQYVSKGILLNIMKEIKKVLLIIEQMSI